MFADFRGRVFIQMASVVVVALSIFSFTGCATIESRHAEARLAQQNTLAVLWFQHAAECRALIYQACNAANDTLSREAPRCTNAAVVVDIDETVLDNSPYQARLIQRGEQFNPDNWNDWVQRFQAQALPGIVELLRDATSRFASNHLEVFYISNRAENQRQTTLTNLQQAGFPNADDRHLLLKTTTSGKEARRDQVAASRQVVLLMGDNLSDFSNVFDTNGAPRTAATDEAREKFGRRFIVFPNPMYGDWEQAFYENKAPTRIKLQRRAEALRGY
jgi:5'-nucleotidase (lipoprotein e(P4) family)